MQLARGQRIVIHAQGIVRGYNLYYGHDGLRWYLRYDIGKHKYSPRIYTRSLFPCLIDISILQELGHDQLYDVAEYCHQHEDREKLILDSL